MTLTLLSPPAVEPVSLSALKDHLRVTHTDEDAVITGGLVAAIRAVEARAGIALAPQGWRLSLDAAPEETIFLPITPCISIDAVTVIGPGGAAAPVGPELYEFAPGAPGRLRRTAPWPPVGPKLDGVLIDFTAGYSGAVPEPLLQAVKTLATHFYESRAACVEQRMFAIPQSVDALIAPYRQVRL